MNIHEKYLNHCLTLAQKGLGRVAPNPMVGCVIVYKDKIIGEGYHREYGSSHAEVNAINSVKNRKHLKGATLYVNLEPCSHFGKTPPCADLIISKGFKYVVIGTLDPNPLVSGRGLKKLVSAGCDVKIGILENKCRELNKRFFTFYERQRPYIVLKWAHTSDKVIGIKNYKLNITSEEANKHVHKWRSEEQAILVGTNTALTDNPRLTVRKVKGNNPVRVLIDRQLKVPVSFHLLNGSVPTIVFTSKNKKSRTNLEYITLNFKKDILKQMMHELYQKNIQSIMIEGGAKILNLFIQNNLWDEARIFSGKKSLRDIAGKKMKGVPAPVIAGRVTGYKKMGDDQVLILNNIS